ncbi:GMC-OxRdtase-N domain-containing protein [Fusarium sp. Ph1]|nr:GMC-OxRdtase-N domain-containing protein [Fusarium sp. Ph1]
MTTQTLPADSANGYDYLIVGGGTAGCVVASRLSAYLPRKCILLIEGGPSDVGDNRVLILKDRIQTIGTDLDYGYISVPQPNGNSHILHSRAKVLGGCSSHNDMISFRTTEYDAFLWQKLGCKGWTFDLFNRLLDKLRTTVRLPHPRDQNKMCNDWIESARAALGVDKVQDFNHLISSKAGLQEGVGWCNVSYDPDTGHRNSASIAYLHPTFRGDEKRPGLTVLTDAWVSKVHLEGDTATSIDVTLKSGEKHTLRAKQEIILCAGAIDTPRLLLLSGIGPREHLESVGIQVTSDIPGVGENLMDHPLTTMLYELNRTPPPNTVANSDTALFLRSKPFNHNGDDGHIPDVMVHIFTIPFVDDLQRLGYEIPEPERCFHFMPLIPRPKSVGRLYLKSSNPHEKPALDFQYFTDKDSYDSSILVDGIKACRKIAEQEPFKSWIKREIAPGPHLTTDAQLDEFARRASGTVYHPACTTKMGDIETDRMAVVDTELRVRGIKGLRVADAGVFPTMLSVNPMLTVLAVGERCAELVALDAGWKEDMPKL